MSGITVVTRRRVRPGQIDAFLALIPEQFERQRQLPNRDTQRIFQSLTDPQQMLAVREWPSREAWEQRDRTRRDRFVALTEGPGETGFYRRLLRFEVVFAPIVHATGTFMRSSAAARDAALAYLKEISPLIEGRPGCVHRSLYENLDDPNQLLTVTGWTSRAAAETTFEALMPQHTVDLAALGVTLEFFHGAAHVELPPDRPV